MARGQAPLGEKWAQAPCNEVRQINPDPLGGAARGGRSDQLLATGGWLLCKNEKVALPGLEPGNAESKSGVLPITL